MDKTIKQIVLYSILVWLILSFLISLATRPYELSNFGTSMGIIGFMQAIIMICVGIGILFFKKYKKFGPPLILLGLCIFVVGFSTCSVCFKMYR